MPICFTPLCFSAPCQFAPLLNLRSFIFSSTPFGWPRSIMLTPYSWCEYNFYLCLFYLHPLVKEGN
jgi:hypothetical protein